MMCSMAFSILFLKKTRALLLRAKLNPISVRFLSKLGSAWTAGLGGKFCWTLPPSEFMI